MDPVSVNDANKFTNFFFCWSWSTSAADVFFDLVTVLLVGCFGATNSVMVLFLDILLAGGRSSTSLVLFLVDVNVNSLSVEATKVVFRTGLHHPDFQLQVWRIQSLSEELGPEVIVRCQIWTAKIVLTFSSKVFWTLIKIDFIFMKWWGQHNWHSSLVTGEVSEIWNQSYKLEKKNHLFFLKTSLIHLGASPDTIGKISWPLKVAILEASTFSINFDKSESKLQRALDTSIFIQYVSVIPFWKAFDIHISENKCFSTESARPQILNLRQYVGG